LPPENYQGQSSSLAEPTLCSAMAATEVAEICEFTAAVPEAATGMAAAATTATAATEEAVRITSIAQHSACPTIEEARSSARTMTC